MIWSTETVWRSLANSTADAVPDLIFQLSAACGIVGGGDAQLIFTLRPTGTPDWQPRTSLTLLFPVK